VNPYSTKKIHVFLGTNSTVCIKTLVGYTLV
jgi:hypothetical protein